jgi:hypothetical protein
MKEKRERRREGIAFLSFRSAFLTLFLSLWSSSHSPFLLFSVLCSHFSVLFFLCSISRMSDGVYEGISIGGDRYPGTSFLDHLKRYEANPDVKILVLLGEVGGIEEYDVIQAMKRKEITKPLVAWCIGTCATLFPYQVSCLLSVRCSGCF